MAPVTLNGWIQELALPLMNLATLVQLPHSLHYASVLPPVKWRYYPFHITTGVKFY